MKVVQEVEEVERDRKRESQLASKEIVKLRSELRVLEDAKAKGETEVAEAKAAHEAEMVEARTEMERQASRIKELEEEKRQEEHRSEVKIVLLQPCRRLRLFFLGSRWLG